MPLFRQNCHQEVIQNLHNLLCNHEKYIAEQYAEDGKYGHPAQEQFVAEMNALVVRDAEEYYRTMMSEDTKSWNLRSVALSFPSVEKIKCLNGDAFLVQRRSFRPCRRGDCSSSRDNG